MTKVRVAEEFSDTPIGSLPARIVVHTSENEVSSLAAGEPGDVVGQQSLVKRRLLDALSERLEPSDADSIVDAMMGAGPFSLATLTKLLAPR